MWVNLAIHESQFRFLREKFIMAPLKSESLVDGSCRRFYRQEWNTDDIFFFLEFPQTRWTLYEGNSIFFLFWVWGGWENRSRSVEVTYPKHKRNLNYIRHFSERCFWNFPQLVLDYLKKLESGRVVRLLTCVVKELCLFISTKPPEIRSGWFCLTWSLF